MLKLEDFMLRSNRVYNLVLMQKVFIIFNQNVVIFFNIMHLLCTGVFRFVCTCF